VVEAIGSSETSVETSSTTRRINQEDQHLNIHRHENLKSYTDILPSRVPLPYPSNSLPTHISLSSPRLIQCCFRQLSPMLSVIRTVTEVQSCCMPVDTGGICSCFFVVIL
jgi:hypothetical protein